MLRVGLTGGIACGKSFVGETLAAGGCLLIQADELGHAVLAPGGEAYRSVIEEFGSTVVTGGGAIDRKALAACVFADPARLARLNAIVHPPVVARENALIAAYAAANPEGDRGGGGGDPDRDRELHAFR